MSIRVPVLAAAAALLSTSSALATDTAALKRELATLEQRISQPAGANTAALKARYEQVHQQLYGAAQSGPAVIDAAGVNQPQFVVAPNAVTPGACGALDYGVAGSTFSFSSSPALAIADLVAVSDVIAVSGVGNQIFDVDLTVAITHTFAADLDISLTSPQGTLVDISSDNGGANDDVFNGTLFDDQSANSATTFVYTNLVAAPDLRPEGGLNASLRGQNPNGNWTLSIFDDAGGDVGILHNWSLSITDGSALSIAPTFAVPTTYSTGVAPVAIVDNTTVSSPLSISGATTSISAVSVYVEITHTWCADMLIQVQSPAGTIVDLSNRRGGTNDNVFNGTLFSMASPNIIGSFAFANNVVATSLRPDGNLGVFAGEDANGTWNLLVNDNAGGDVGSINRWDLNLSGCAREYGVYCNAGTSLNGCVPTLSATGDRSITGSFVVTASNVDGQRNGQIYYSLSPAAIPFGAGTLCVGAPRQRVGMAIYSGGTAGLCDGSLSADIIAFGATHPSALGVPFAAGNTLFIQASVRDNGNTTKNRVMTDAIAVTLVP